MRMYAIIMLFLWSSIISAQSISVDMIPDTAGIQDSMNSTVSGEEFIVEFIGSNFANVSGYQFKIVFDSSRFSYSDNGAVEYAMSGKKNILKANGGSISQIFQRQTNPPCDSVIDVAATINGITDLSISGTGLLGIAQFKSKLQPGESGVIKIIDGYIVDFNGVKTPITTYAKGNYHMLAPVVIAFTQSDKQMDGFQMSCDNNSLHFYLPFAKNMENRKTEITIYDLNGRVKANLFSGYLSVGIHAVSLQTKGTKLGQGFYLCNIRYGNKSGSVKIFVGN